MRTFNLKRVFPYKAKLAASLFYFLHLQGLVYCFSDFDEGI